MDMIQLILKIKVKMEIFYIENVICNMVKICQLLMRNGVNAICYLSQPKKGLRGHARDDVIKNHGCIKKN